MTDNNTLRAALLCCAFGAFCLPSTSHAANVAVNAVGTCQAALPAFEGLIRKRPLAVQNDGSSTAFVTCAFPTVDTSGNGASSATFVGMNFSATDGAQHLVTCTLVTGTATFFNQYSTKSVFVNPNGMQNGISWTAGDFQNTVDNQIPSAWVTASCVIPAGVGINDLRINAP